MIIDYIEVEKQGDANVCTIGVQFVDEPNEYYVVIWEKHEQGWKSSPELWFNGVECKYHFTQEELALLTETVHQWMKDHDMPQETKGGS
jgi:hypothetical protein